MYTRKSLPWKEFSKCNTIIISVLVWMKGPTRETRAFFPRHTQSPYTPGHQPSASTSSPLQVTVQRPAAHWHSDALLHWDGPYGETHTHTQRHTSVTVYPH